MQEDQVGEPIYQEDALAWVLQQGQDPAATGPAEILEVSQIFGDSVVDMRYFSPGQAVRVGAGTVHRLKLAGLEVGEIPGSLSKLAWLAPGLVSVEEGWKHPFQVPGDLFPEADHTLFQPEGKRWVAKIPQHWRGFVEQKGQRKEIDSKAGADGLCMVEVPAEGILALDAGGILFIARPVPRSKSVRLEPLQGDTSLLAMAGFFAFLVGMLGISTRMIPPPVVSSQSPELEAITLILQRPSQEAPAPAPKGEAGKIGKTDATQKQAKGALPKEHSAREVANQAGILGALAEDSDLNAALSTTGLSGDLQKGIGGLIGAQGTQQGSGGLAMRGGGLGGGGTADELGGIAVKGGGHGISDAHFTERGPSPEIQVPPDVTILGGLDKSLIDAVIKRNLTAIRYCYQRELTRNPTLSGKVKVRFVISSDGSVSSSSTSSSTLNNSTAESCINGRIMHMGFPAPRGGGMVVVSYPFLFSSN